MRRIVVGLLAAALACVTLVPVAASATTIAAKCDFRATVTFSPGLTPTAQPVDYTISGNLWSSRRDCPATSASPAVLQGIVHSDAAYCNGTAVLGEPAVGLPHMEWQGGAHSRVRLVLKSVEPRLLRLKGLVKSGVLAGDLVKGPLEVTYVQGSCTVDHPITALLFTSGNASHARPIVFSLP